MNTITLSDGKYLIRKSAWDGLEVLAHGGLWGRYAAGDTPVIAMFHRLLELSWTPIIERPPTEEDANEYGDVDWSDGKDIWEAHYTEPREATHWRRIVLP